MEIYPLKSSLIKAKLNLVQSLAAAFSKNNVELREKDIVVISSKVVALCEGRIIDLSKIKVSKRARSIKVTRYGSGKEDPRIVELALRESDLIIPGNMLLTIKNGVFIPEAGIDLSNAPKGFAILWPKNPARTARFLWQKLRKKFRLKKLGIIISDSHCQPLRWGTVGLGLAWAGFYGVEDARGQKDIYGKPLRVTRKAVADNLASAALIMMGEAGEKIPFAIARGAPVKFTNRIQTKREKSIHPKDCIFAGVYCDIIKQDYETSNATIRN